tara:strand:+ start:31 stop:357 length:327 start_codon:yes stop_codon:yes gene_type:complete
MTDIVLSKKSVFFNEWPASSDSHGNKTYFCYATLASTQKQVEKVLSEGRLPRYARIKGKNPIDFKIACYQDDGYWFQSEPIDGKSHRLWVPFKDETKLKQIAKKQNKG